MINIGVPGLTNATTFRSRINIVIDVPEHVHQQYQVEAMTLEAASEAEELSAHNFVVLSVIGGIDANCLQATGSLEQKPREHAEPAPTSTTRPRIEGADCLNQEIKLGRVIPIFLRHPRNLTHFFDVHGPPLS